MEAMNELTLNFDVILLLMLLAMLLIGYISGATAELLRIIRLVVPFIVVYCFGPSVIRYLYPHFRKWLSYLAFLRKMPYFNTFIVALITILLFVATYAFLFAFLKELQKILQAKLFVVKIKTLNQSLGAILAGIRFYILASVLIMPFFLLQVTTKNDVITSVLIEYPPAFTQVDYLTKEMIPLKEKIVALSDMLNLIELKPMKELLQDYQTQITVFETRTMDLAQKIVASGGTLPFDTENPKNVLNQFNSDYIPFLHATEDVDIRIEIVKLQNDIAPYTSIIKWAYAKDVFLQEQADILNQFTTDFSLLQQDTLNETMRQKLASVEPYVRVNQWLNELNEGVTMLSQSNDMALEKLLNNLVLELDQPNGLIAQLKVFNAGEFAVKMKRIESFLHAYNEEDGKRIAELGVEMPFNAKLLAVVLNRIDLLGYLDHSPLIAMYLNEFLAKQSKTLVFGTDGLYEYFIKAILPLYVVEVVNGETQLSEARMTTILAKIEHYIEQLSLTETTVQRFTEALVTAKVNLGSESISYLNYLINEQQMTEEALMVLRNHHLFVNNELITEAIDALLGGEG